MEGEDLDLSGPASLAQVEARMLAAAALAAPYGEINVALG